MSSTFKITESTKHDLKKNILIIKKLFNKLVDIYKYNFSNDLIKLLIPRIDINKINLFKNVVLEIIKDHNYINKLQNDFFQECLTLYHSKSNNNSEKACLLLKKYWLKILNSIVTANKKDKRKLTFYFNNWLDYLYKQKYLFENFTLNPNNIKTIQNNLLHNIKTCLTDLIINQGHIDIKFNNQTSFNIGNNVATSKGIIIYKNDIMELIQYFPINSNTFNAPLLFIPPCINKYYILDLSQNNSLVKCLLEKGFSVYMISWVNPDASHANITFSDYIINGPLQAIDIITKTSKSKVHLAGYCMGGTMLSCVLSYMQKTNDLRALSATHFMSLLDFSNFKNLNQDSLNKLEQFTNKIGYLDGRLLSMAFNIVHINELIWPYFINYYLFKQPLSNFDTLYWNCDPVNLTAKMYNFYLRTICFQNKLSQPNAITINGVGIDLSKITVPIFAVAGEQDHISPFSMVYSSLNLYSLSYNKQFVLTNAGHVTGLVNSPINKQCSYKAISENKINNLITNDINYWLKNATEYSGSWWTYWMNWLLKIDSTKRIRNSNSQTSIITSQTLQQDAPGSYIKKKLLSNV